MALQTPHMWMWLTIEAAHYKNDEDVQDASLQTAKDIDCSKFIDKWAGL